MRFQRYILSKLAWNRHIIYAHCYMTTREERLETDPAYASLKQSQGEESPNYGHNDEKRKVWLYM